MKKLVSLFLALALLAMPALALVKQVTTVSATASVIFTPGANCLWVTIQNNGSGAVRLSFDGQNLPTASTGYLLAAGAQVMIAYGGSSQKPVIRAILVTGTTTTLDINTSDNSSS